LRLRGSVSAAGTAAATGDGEGLAFVDGMVPVVCATCMGDLLGGGLVVAGATGIVSVIAAVCASWMPDAAGGIVDVASASADVAAAHSLLRSASRTIGNSVTAGTAAAGAVIAGPCASWTPETGPVNSGASDTNAGVAGDNSVWRISSGAGRGKGIAD